MQRVECSGLSAVGEWSESAESGEWGGCSRLSAVGKWSESGEHKWVVSRVSQVSG